MSHTARAKAPRPDLRSFRSYVERRLLSDHDFYIFGRRPIAALVDTAWISCDYNTEQRIPVQPVSRSTHSALQRCSALCVMLLNIQNCVLRVAITQKRNVTGWVGLQEPSSKRSLAWGFQGDTQPESDMGNATVCFIGVHCNQGLPQHPETGMRHCLRFRHPLF